MKDKNRKKEFKETKNILSGKWFHSFGPDNWMLHWQGQILGIIQKGYYLIQVYDWIVGCASAQHLVSIDTMTHWVFYDSNDEMNDEYKRIYAHREPKEGK